jgi:hypothetical protein
MASPERRPARRWLPTLAVLGVIVFVSGGSRAVGDALAGPAGPPVDVGGVAIVHPVTGWEVAARTAAGGIDQVLFRRGAAGLLVGTIQGYGRPVEELAGEYADDALDGRFAQLTIGDPARDDAGRLGFGYVGVTDDGVAVEGVAIAEVAASGDAVVFDGFAPEGDLAAAVEDVRTMVNTAEVA